MDADKTAVMEKLSDDYRRSCEKSARKELHDIVDKYFDSPDISAVRKNTMFTVIVNLLKVQG